jgi:hypothetical protein
MAAIETKPAAAVGRLARWKLTEPVRLYVYALQLAAGVVVLVAAALNADPAALMFAVPTVVLFWFSAWAGVAAARASVYSPRTVLQTMLRIRNQ